ncbi:MAG: hypothetical protein Q3976_01745 [Corynebacterium sp.]|nr:hypothetical protein [Corynebacterium sp.]
MKLEWETPSQPALDDAHLLLGAIIAPDTPLIISRIDAIMLGCFIGTGHEADDLPYELAV